MSPIGMWPGHTQVSRSELCACKPNCWCLKIYFYFIFYQTQTDDSSKMTKPRTSGHCFSPSQSSTPPQRQPEVSTCLCSCSQSQPRSIRRVQIFSYFKYILDVVDNIKIVVYIKTFTERGVSRAPHQVGLRI